MRRLLIGAVLVAGVFVVVRRMKTARRAGSSPMAERFAAMCERMLADMPDSFPPNRMMADLETIKQRTGVILEALERRVETERPQEILTP